MVDLSVLITLVNISKSLSVGCSFDNLMDDALTALECMNAGLIVLLSHCINCDIN